MSIPFTRWPEEFARRYREKGYWQDLPLTDILTRHATSDSIAVIDGERQLSYRELNQAADNLACSLRRQGIKPGETALVQLGNVAELYITFFALLKLGVAPVLALFSHQRSDCLLYTSPIKAIGPTTAVALPQSTVIASRPINCVRATRLPSAVAVSLPRLKLFSARLSNSAVAPAVSTGISTTFKVCRLRRCV